MFIHIQANTYKNITYTYTQAFHAIVIHSLQKFRLEIKPRTHRKARIAAQEIEKKEKEIRKRKKKMAK